tara:strand:- start:197 stop:511 length:315 start_codon:yes stop_codon:yes gene_type:complete
MKISKERLNQIIKEEVISVRKMQMGASDSMDPSKFLSGTDAEGDMAKSQMLKAHDYSTQIMQVLDDETQLPSWVQAKLTMAAKSLAYVWHYLDGKMRDPDNNKM